MQLIQSSYSSKLFLKSGRSKRHVYSVRDKSRLSRLAQGSIRSTPLCSLIRQFPVLAALHKLAESGEQPLRTVTAVAFHRDASYGEQLNLNGSGIWRGPRSAFIAAESDRELAKLVPSGDIGIDHARFFLGSCRQLDPVCPSIFLHSNFDQYSAWCTVRVPRPALP